MIARIVFSPDVLQELGWLTLVYSYLDENLTLFLSAVSNPDDPTSLHQRLAAEGIRSKVKKLRRAVTSVSKAHHIYEEFEEVGLHIEEAVSRRNELVHGFVLFADDGSTPISKRIHKSDPPHPITIVDVQATHRSLSDANTELLVFAGRFWKKLVEARRRERQVPPPSA